MSRKPALLVGPRREKLLVALVADDAVNILNTVFKARGLTFHLDYTGPMPTLSASRPGVEPETFITADSRTKKSWFHPIANPDLGSALADLLERLAKIEARLLLVIQKDRQGRRWAKLQLHVAGSRGIALTILDINRGRKVSDNAFALPGSPP